MSVLESVRGIRPVSMLEVRNRLTDFTLILFAVLGFPALTVSLLRVREFGWMGSMSVHAGVYAFLVILCFLRRRLPLNAKAVTILGLLFILGSWSYPSLAAAGSGVFFYLTTVVLATLFYGFRGGFISFLLCLTGLLAALTAARAGFIDLEVDLNLYSLSLSAWGAKIAAFTLLGGLSLGLMSFMQEWLTGSIREMEGEIEEHRRTEERLEASLSEKEVLLPEVHHRVKSNLQAISGLLDVHRESTADPGPARAISDSQSRIRVMAQIHEELYGSRDLSSIDFSHFLKRLATGILTSYGADTGNISLKLETEPVTMVVDTAIPCGLIVNELVTNSIKYAFPGAREGTIRIAFSRLGEDRYQLVVADDGVGMLPGAEVGNTLGLRLVEALSGQLGAETTLSSRGGTTFTMVFREYREAGSQVY